MKWKVTLVFSPFDPEHYQNRVVSHVFDSRPDDEQIKRRFDVARFTKPWETVCAPGSTLHPYASEIIGEESVTEPTDPMRHMRVSGVATDATYARIAKSKFEDRRASAVSARLEALCRVIAAEKMNLLNDATGNRLPDELWKQAEPLALAVMTLIQRDVS